MAIEVKKIIENLETEIDEIVDPKAKRIISLLLKIIEAQAETIQKQASEIKELKDEISRLKGEQGKPDIRKQTQKSQDHSSEKERKPSPGSKTVSA